MLNDRLKRQVAEENVKWFSMLNEYGRNQNGDAQ